MICFFEEIHFQNESFQVTCLNGARLHIVTEDDKTSVKESFAQYEAFRKRIGKHLSKSMMREWNEISPKHVLNLSFASIENF